MSEIYAEVILPLSLHDSFTYRVPQKFEKKIQTGIRVVVQFGQKRLYAALVVSISNEKPKEHELKEIQQILDDRPVVLPQNFRLWNWMAKYYCCTLGDVFRAALPSGLKMESKSKIIVTSSEFQEQINYKENLILQTINSETTSLNELQNQLGKQFSYSALKTLLNKNIIQIEEKINSRYKPKTETFVKLNSKIKSEDELNNKVEELTRAKKQAALLFHFCDKTNVFEEKGTSGISKKDLLEGTNFSSAVLQELVKKKFLSTYQKQISRLDIFENKQVSINMLNKNQEIALNKIKNQFTSKAVVLLHGVTASGKTEIYIHLIDEILKSGKQALYLVPEIALTTQIIQRLKNVFGKKVGIYHSKLSSQERVEIWEKVLEFENNKKEGYQVILGARSAVFMPFSNLGLIIVDEEHENSFKQFDPAPRYNARDMAVILGFQNNAKVVLGSATPSFESYYNTRTQKYGLVELNNRHSNVELPEIIVADVKKAYKKKQMHAFLSPELYHLMEEALQNNEQIILFQNRRGYSPFVECFSCGWIPKCNNCDVSLTYHKYKNKLTCHYCGFSLTMPNECHNCGSPEIKSRGFGTEKIEDELKPLFRNARIARMDLDTTQTKNAFKKIIDNLENRKTDILIGTQMVTKGLDFDNVSVVGILNADNLINFPDFRAHERAYQLISQVSGRAGRKYKQGKVVIQTSQPDHLLIQLIKEQNYTQALNSQLEERQLFRYPPYCRLIKLIVKHKNLTTVERVANQLSNVLKTEKSLIILGPEFPLISRIQLWHHKEIWIKINKKLDLDKVKQFVIQCIKQTKHLPDNSSCMVNIDVDPN